MPAASYSPLFNLRKGLFFAIGEGSRIPVACFLHSSVQMCWYQTAGRRPPRITGRFVSTVTRGWVRAPDKAPHSDFMAQSLVLSIDACEGLGFQPLRTNILQFSQVDIGPRSAQDFFFLFGVYEKLEAFCEDLCS